jgi:SAM-dependent methyltransferase
MCCGGGLPPAPDIPRHVLKKSYVFRGRSFDLFPQLIESFTQLLDRLGTKAYAENAELVDRLQTFIQFVLPVESSAERLKSILSQSALFYHTRKGRDPKAPVHLDHAVYEQLKQHYHGSLYARIKSQITSLRILRQTRGQIGGEMKELLDLLPDKGRSIRRIACIGDHGRYINVLASALPEVRELHNIHDASNHWLTRIEAGVFLLPNLSRHLIDYNAVSSSLAKSTISSTQQFDLITMAQGLHHLSVSNLDAFLRFVSDRLAPGGYFIIREHDAQPGSQVGRMADFAHILFNASTGVSWSEEQLEVRNFQSVDTWKSVVEGYGLEACVLMNRPDPDSTEEYMWMVRQKRAPEHEVDHEVEDAEQQLTQPMSSSSVTATTAASTSSFSALKSAAQPDPAGRDPADTLFMPAE